MKLHVRVPVCDEHTADTAGDLARRLTALLAQCIPAERMSRENRGRRADLTAAVLYRLAEITQDQALIRALAKYECDTGAVHARGAAAVADQIGGA